MRTNPYVVRSLELHLFFCRIMKEHAFFLRAGFTPAEPECAAKAEFYFGEFENLLKRTVEMSNCIAGRDVLCSGEVVTEFTCEAEKQTACLTGIPINREITDKALCLQASDCPDISAGLRQEVRQLNRTVLRLLDGLIAFQEMILKKVLHGEIFTVNYPLLIEHITREAKLYRRYVASLEKDGDLPQRSMRDIECFWNQIMMEHAQFIRGLLDPCETDLFHAADDFSNKFCALLEVSRSAHSQTLTEKALAETEKLRDFKAAGVQGIQECKIRSIILPLLADHVLREANHYIRLLKC